MHDHLTDDQMDLLWLLATLATDASAMSDFLGDPAGYLDQQELTPEARAAILSGDAKKVADEAGVPEIKPIRESA